MEWAVLVVVECAMVVVVEMAMVTVAEVVAVDKGVGFLKGVVEVAAKRVHADNWRSECLTLWSRPVITGMATMETQATQRHWLQ